MSLTYAETYETQTAERVKPLWSYLWPWMLMIPMLVFAAASQFSFQAGAQNTDAGASLAGAATGAEAKGQREMLIVTYLILLTLITTRYKRVMEMALEMKALTLLGLLAVLSTIWSQQPLVSLVRGMYYFIDTLFAYWVVTKLTSSQLRSLVMMIGSAVSFCSIILVLAFPRYGLVGTLAHLGAWQGIFAEKNHAGEAMVFLLTPVVDFSRRLNIKRGIYAAVVVLLVIMSQSRTAWVAVVLYPLVMLVLYFTKRVESRLALLVAVGTIATVGVSAALIIPNLAEILGLFGRDLTLTGRTGVWKLVVQAIADRPLLGYGYSAFWQGLIGASGKIILTLGWAFGYAHDGYLEVLLQVGIVGLALVVCVLLSGMRDAWICFQASDDPAVSWYIGILFLTLFYNFDEETLFFAHNQNTFLLLLACCGLRLARRQIALAKAAATDYEDDSFEAPLPAAARSITV
jgi:O-antigen ligase